MYPLIPLKNLIFFLAVFVLYRNQSFNDPYTPPYQDQEQSMNKSLYSMAACFLLSAAISLVALADQDGSRPPRDGGGRGFDGPPRGSEGGPEERGRGGPEERGRGGPDIMRMIPVMAALDKDGDGVISSDEIAGAVAALKTLDKNNDGRLDGEELRPAFGGPGGPGGRGPGGFGGPGGPGGPGGGRDGGSGDGAAMIVRLMAMDKNSDGQLSKDEMGDRLGALFSRADVDKNGFVTRAEIEVLSGPESGLGQGGDRPRRPAPE
jgi:hypothetical protein